MKRTLTTAACAAALVASLAACGSDDGKTALPNTTASSSPSATTTGQPTTMPPTATTTNQVPPSLAPHSTNTYGGLKVVVNLPTDIPTASQPSMRLFSAFLQAKGRTTAGGKLDPALPDLAGANVVKYVQSTIGGESVQEIGSAIYTISTVHKVSHGPTLLFGCLDQKDLVQVRKNGSTFVAANTRKHPTLKMSAQIDTGVKTPGLEVTSFTFAAGPC